MLVKLNSYEVQSFSIYREIRIPASYTIIKNKVQHRKIMLEVMKGHGWMKKEILNYREEYQDSDV